MARYLPIAMDVEDKLCLVVGGGKVAERRVRTLLEAGARVRVAAPVIGFSAENLEYLREPFIPEHLEGVILAIAATDSPEVNEYVSLESGLRGIPVCDACSHTRGDFVVPSVIRRGDLLISVSSGGASPALAARIGREIEETYGPEYAVWMDILLQARELAQKIPDGPLRHRTLKELALDDSTLDMIREGRVPEARARALSCILSLLD